ncbi:aminotransferase class I/II-fold pyridoxal phosphate-dependent enzyme [archaeon]|nr:MAG: aminotransferase class I/II-fold pyridoxal phosphate-dependent enzyme [archaeon]
MAIFFVISSLWAIQTGALLLPKRLLQPVARIVDLRSDTVTKPTPLMRRVMSEAEVGDDVFGEDPTLNLLESRVAKMFNKEKALFLPSGTMSNLVAIMTWCTSRGSEMILGNSSHIHLFEQGGMSTIGGVASKLLPNKADGTIDLDQIEASIRSQNIHFPQTELITLENTHNYCGGRVLPSKYMEEVGWLSSRRSVPVHLDGARIWNTAAATGKTVEHLTQSVSSVSVCLSKGLGAPAGSLLVGPSDFVQKARRLRKALGGGMRQVGILAAAGLQALDDFEGGMLEHDHKRAKHIASELSSIPGLRVDVDTVESNIVLIHLDYYISTSVQAFVDKLKERNVLLLPFGTKTVRLVVHRDITDEDCAVAIGAVRDVAAVSWVQDDEERRHILTSTDITNTVMILSSPEPPVVTEDNPVVVNTAPVPAPAPHASSSNASTTTITEIPFANATGLEETQVFGMSVSDQGFCVFLQGLICDRFVKVQVTPSDPMVYGLDRDQAESSEAVTLLQLLQGIDVESFLPKGALSSRFNDGKLKYKLMRVVVDDLQDNGAGFRAKLIAQARKQDNSQEALDDETTAALAPPKQTDDTNSDASAGQESATRIVLREAQVSSPFMAIALALRHHAPIEVRSDYFHNEQLAYTLDELRQGYPKIVDASTHQPLLQQVESSSIEQNISKVNGMIERLQRLLQEARRQRNEQKAQMIAGRLEMLEKIVGADSLLLMQPSAESSTDPSI